MQAPPEGDPCGSGSHTKEALTKPSCPPSPCGLSMPSAAARGPGGSSAAAAPARTASCRCAIPPRPSANRPWPGCSGAPSAVARSPPAQPHRALRPEQAASSRWVTWGRRCRPDSGCSVQEDRLGCRKAMRPSNTGPRCVGRYPVTHRPVIRCPGQGRRPPPAGPAYRAHRPRHAPAALVTRWERRCRGFQPLAPAPRQSARVRSPSRRAARRRRGP